MSLLYKYTYIFIHELLSIFTFICSYLLTDKLFSVYNNVYIGGEISCSAHSLSARSLNQSIVNRVVMHATAASLSASAVIVLDEGQTC